MKLISALQMREIDHYTIENLGISGVSLMSNAAEQLAKVAMEFIPTNGKVAIFCGTGNNGGDGIGAAAYLLEKGIPVRTFLVAENDNAETDILTSDSKEMLNRLLEQNGSLELYSQSSDLSDYLNTCAVVIDAIFGVGLNSNLRTNTLSAVNAINNSGATIISADIPSGVHADSGSILGDSVNADVTVTFTLGKPGLFVEPGCTKSGDIRICNIGIPNDVIERTSTNKYVATANDIHLPHRRKDTHKGNYGRALIIAGSIGYTGAPSLASKAASKIGAGLVSLGAPEPIYQILATKLTEEMPFPLPSDTKGRLTANAASEILRRAENSDVCLIGPGLGNSDDLTELVSSVTRLSETSIILDADGLNAISGNTDILRQANCPLILTPHMGEFVRLGGKLDGNRIKSATDFAIEYGCILVLKGHRTITALPNGTAYVNTTGGPAMAKGGTGDVLAGMIAALIAQKFPAVHATITAVYLHGLAGDMCAKKLGEYSVLASDIIDMLPEAIKIVVK